MLCYIMLCYIMLCYIELCCGILDDISFYSRSNSYIFNVTWSYLSTLIKYIIEYLQIFYVSICIDTELIIYVYKT